MAASKDPDARLADLLFAAALEHGAAVGDQAQSDSDLKTMLRAAVRVIKAAGKLEAFKAELVERLGEYPEYEFIAEEV